jgi:hypothetical protein
MTEHKWGHPFSDYIESDCANLRPYVERIRKLYYEDYKQGETLNKARPGGVVLLRR